MDVNVNERDVTLNVNIHRHCYKSYFRFVI